MLAARVGPDAKFWRKLRGRASLERTARRGLVLRRLIATAELRAVRFSAIPHGTGPHEPPHARPPLRLFSRVWSPPESEREAGILAGDSRWRVWERAVRT
eukprot:2446842-Prymnesium_polylepis.1